jgi:hypothetical protein
MQEHIYFVIISQKVFLLWYQCLYALARYIIILLKVYKQQFYINHYKMWRNINKHDKRLISINHKLWLVKKHNRMVSKYHPYHSRFMNLLKDLMMPHYFTNDHGITIRFPCFYVLKMLFGMYFWLWCYNVMDMIMHTFWETKYHIHTHMSWKPGQMREWGICTLPTHN